MESSEMGNAPVPFMRQMLDNKILLLTVCVGVFAILYFVIGLYMMLSR